IRYLIVTGVQTCALPISGTTILLSVNFTNNAIRPFPGYTSVTYTEFGATSNYNALQTRLSRRFATHLTVNVSYVWSKAMDETDRSEERRVGKEEGGKGGE